MVIHVIDHTSITRDRDIQVRVPVLTEVNHLAMAIDHHFRELHLPADISAMGLTSIEGEVGAENTVVVPKVITWIDIDLMKVAWV